jgi:hypothetical protein
MQQSEGGADQNTKSNKNTMVTVGQSTPVDAAAAAVETAKETAAKASCKIKCLQYLI